MLRKLKAVARFALDVRIWKPSNARLVWSHYTDRFDGSYATDKAHILSALDWLKRAQDSTKDGGVSGRFLLNKGWTDSYPETSGYIIPTLIEVGELYKDPDCKARCKNIVDFLYSVQMDCGAFPGGEHNPCVKSHPIVFNTGQIIIGLVAWYNLTRDKRALESLDRACKWLVEVQEDDGSWKRFTYGTIATAYHTRVAWPLAMYGKLVGDDKSLRSADRFIEWVLRGANSESGWVAKMDFADENHESNRSITHTLAYTYRGLLEYAMITGRQDITDLVGVASGNMIDRFEQHDYLSGIMDSNWNNREPFTCLTGNCQLSIIWLKLYQLNNDTRFLKSATKLLDVVKRYHSLTSSSAGIRGGISGSAPIWGQYIKYGYPNWAVKFFIDALILLNRVTGQLRS